MTVVDPDNPFVKQRHAIHEVISASISDDPDHEGHILAGWVLIFETVGPDGERGMQARSGDASGDLDLTPWTAEGWCRYAAASGYFDGVDEDEDG